MTWTVSTTVVPVIVAFILGWAGREWFEMRRIASMAAAYDPYAEQLDHQPPAPPTSRRTR